VGDIPTLTVREYLKRSRWGRLRYRMFRHPLILFGIGPTVLFGILYRFPKGSKSSWKIERASVAWTNVAILGVCVALGLAIGLRGFAAIQVPITMLAASMGAWLFYTQHQFKDAYWATSDDWNPTYAALQGSAHYDLPPVLHWFTGNIGFHHIHHLDARIASYNLQRCHREHPELAATTVLTLRSSLATVPLSLWDEHSGQLVSFAEVERGAAQAAG
jgi:omega-6 fatty acid desaturase (delta-12 desaturase)